MLPHRKLKALELQGIPYGLPSNSHKYMHGTHIKNPKCKNKENKNWNVRDSVFSSIHTTEGRSGYNGQLYVYSLSTVVLVPLIRPVLRAAIRPTFLPADRPRPTVEALPMCWWLPPPCGCSTGFIATPRTWSTNGCNYFRALRTD